MDRTEFLKMLGLGALSIPFFIKDADAGCTAVIDCDECVLCGACVRRCPQEAVYWSSSGENDCPLVDYLKCNCCRKCLGWCPVECITYSDNTGDDCALVKINKKNLTQDMYARVNCDTCVYCGKCISVCPVNAITEDEENECVIIDRVECIGCAECAVVCPAHSITMIGQSKQE